MRYAYNTLEGAMKITITLEDGKDGQVRVEETRHFDAGGYEVTAAFILAEEMLALLEEHGAIETV